MKKLSDKFVSVLNDISDYDFFIAGGAVACAYFEIEDEKQDMDIFFRNENDFNKLNDFFSSNNKYTLKLSTNNANTYVYEKTKGIFDIKIVEETIVQLIKRDFGTPEYIISKFDINKCMIALDIQNKKLIYDERFYKPLYTIAYHVQTLNRIAKYSYRTGESYDWVNIIEKFYSNISIDNFYNNSKVKSKKYLESFLKNYLTDINDFCKNDITNALSKYITDYEMINFLNCIFIPIDLKIDRDLFMILYYNKFSKVSNTVWVSKDKAKNFDEKKKICHNFLVNKFPEYLFV